MAPHHRSTGFLCPHCCRCRRAPSIGEAENCPHRAPAAPRERSRGLWRPWLITRKERERSELCCQNLAYGLYQICAAGGKLPHYQHPVRLFWPKSKCYDYLYQEAEVLLKNFPVQATIAFYEDSDSDSDDSDVEHDSGIESD
ncbi:protein ripply2-like [Microcaecilia unicolor]|uniref:Protein ripply2-like n=1 Tax=Microcaecilia unicolor TaxID=1415580 RepID=A0A6P7XK85_9AMPH|nr:protein ripply2-like [Microcaecilia unicolor]